MNSSNPPPGRVDSHAVALSLLTLVPGRVGGSESYVRGLLGGLAENPSAERILVLANRHVMEAYRDRVRPPLALQPVASYRSGSGTATRTLALAGARLAPRLAARSVPRGLDVVHYPLTVPIPQTAAARVVTLHDVQHHVLPHYFSRAERIYRSWAYDAAARNATRVITVSEHGRRTAIDRLGLDPERVRAIHWGLDHARFHPDASADDPGALELPERFLLYPANTWPHKNHERLLEALARSRSDVNLVLTGAGYGRVRGLLKLADALGVRARVRHLGYVEAATMPVLYRRATALVFPSLYEGFGGPPLEAMACGCPVASSMEASLAEVCGDAALPFDAHDADAIAAAIDRIVTDEPLRARLRAAGLARAAGFTWETAAAAHLETYREAATG